MTGEHAQFEPAEQKAIRDAVSAGEKPVCPRDGSAAARSDSGTRAGANGSSARRAGGA